MNKETYTPIAPKPGIDKFPEQCHKNTNIITTQRLDKIFWNAHKMYVDNTLPYWITTFTISEYD